MDDNVDSHQNETLAPNREERVFLVLVDGSEEMMVALRYAAIRARHTGGQVALLVVHEPEEFQYFAGVEKILRTEKEEDTQNLLRGLAQDIQKLSGKEALVYIKRGDVAQEIITLVKAEKSIKVLVLASSKTDTKPGPIIHQLSEGLISDLPVAVTLIPGFLREEDIQLLA